MRLSRVVNWLNPAAPKGLISDATAWVNEQQRKCPQLRQPQPTAWVREVFPAENAVQLLGYNFISTPDEEFSSVRWTATPAASLYYLRGARLLGDEGAVISSDNRVFAEFTMPPASSWQEHSCFRRGRIPPLTPLKGWYATVAWPESKFFFHWMIESLPRVALLGDYLSALDGIFVPSPLQSFHKESLAMLGIPLSKLVPLGPQAHFAPEHLFVPRAFAMYNPPSWLHRWYKSAFELPSRQDGTESRRRIYVSRADAPARRVANEDEVVAELEKRGFEPVRLTDMPFADQARLFNEAEIIIAPHGAGLSNLVFCNPGTVVLEVLPPNWMAPCFMSLAASAGLSYRHLRADTFASQGRADPQRDAVLLPTVQITALLDAMGI
jgi:capsular polysaccharide biosynthesis protein